jgi:predicted dehydrogenase
MQDHQTITRRSLLKGALAAGAAVACPTLIPDSARGTPEKAAPSQRVVTGVVGLGFAWQMFTAGPEVQCVAICDVQRQRRDPAQHALGGPSQCAAYNDFRELLARDDIDAIYTATPDHWHALVTIAAAKAGKHVYCQKPLTRMIAEGRAVVEAVRRYGIVFQHGTQQRHDAKMLFGCELVRNGYIGQLQEVRIGVPLGLGGGSTQPEPVPPGLDWNMWLGPAPWAPFTPLRIRPHNWYFISDYSDGYVSSWGVHHADSAQEGSGLDDAQGVVEVEARGESLPGLMDNPFKWDMHYHFPNNVTWHVTDTSDDWDGRTPSPGAGEWNGKKYPMGIFFKGSEGWVYIWRGLVDAQPKSLLEVKIGSRDKVHLVNPGGRPIPGFIECVKKRLETCAPVEIAHRSTNLCSIGAIAMAVQRPLKWDMTKEEFLDDQEANRLQSRAMRPPWRL